MLCSMHYGSDLLFQAQIPRYWPRLLRLWCGNLHPGASHQPDSPQLWLEMGDEDALWPGWGWSVGWSHYDPCPQSRREGSWCCSRAGPRQWWHSSLGKIKQTTESDSWGGSGSTSKSWKLHDFRLDKLSSLHFCLYHLHSLTNICRGENKINGWIRSDTSLAGLFQYGLERD